MSSQRKTESAQQNGAKSQGPKTPEGKERSCMNALRHGVTASKVVLATEERPQFDELRANYIEKFNPADEVESNLVDQMVIATWRMYRISAGEAALFDMKIQQQSIDAYQQFPGIDSSGRFAIALKALADDSQSLRLMQRYETNCRHQYDRALRALLDLRKSIEPEPVFHPPTKVIFCGNKTRCDRSNPRADCNFTNGPPPEREIPNEPNPISAHRPEPAQNDERTTNNDERATNDVVRQPPGPFSL